MTRHCLTCTCETAAQAAEREKRIRQEKLDKERMEEFARRHSVLSEADVAWARRRLEDQKR